MDRKLIELLITHTRQGKLALPPNTIKTQARLCLAMPWCGHCNVGAGEDADVGRGPLWSPVVEVTISLTNTIHIPPALVVARRGGHDIVDQYDWYPTTGG